ncbi:Elongator subunit elp2 [Leucoagaricus gongylophorus]
MAASTVFIAASTNRFSHAASTSLSSLVALGAGNLLALWDASNISECLPGHNAAITCVRFISNERLMTGDEQGMLFLWRMDGEKWTLVSKVKAHGKALTSLSTLGDTVVSGSSDSTVKVWEVAVSG